MTEGFITSYKEEPSSWYNFDDLLKLYFTPKTQKKLFFLELML